MDGIIEKLRIAGWFLKSQLPFRTWCMKAVTRNVQNRWVLPLSPTARGYTKLGKYLAKMGYCDLEVLADQADCGVISEVKKYSDPKKEGGRMNNIESATGSLGDVVTNLLTKAVNMFPGSGMEDRKKTLSDLEEIENSHVNDECILDL